MNCWPPVLNLCKLIKDGPVYISDNMKPIILSEVEKTIEVIRFITKTNESEPFNDFFFVIDKVEEQLTDDEKENYLEFTDGQEKHDALWYKSHLGIPEPVKWENGCYVLNGKNKIYYIIDDNGHFVGSSLEGHFMFHGINQMK